MLHVLAKTDATSMRANRHSKLGSQQNDRKIFIYSCKPAAIDLTYIQGSTLQELLKHHPIVTVLACCNSNLGYFPADSSMTQDVVRTCRFLQPPGLKFGELSCAFDGLGDIPLLIGV